MIRVLIVDDSPTVRLALRQMLERDADLQVAGEAPDGQQAIKMTARLAPDLILMDVVMPDMDGLEATRRIMASQPTPILIVTGHADSPDLDIVFEAMKAGAVDVVRHPSGPDLTGNREWGESLAQKIKALAGVRPRPVTQGDPGDPG